MTVIDYISNFSNNLYTHRKRLGITQRELGEMLNFSEKTVSKWEIGASIPSADVLLRMSEIFNISIDALLKSSCKRLYLGIDGGGTKTALELTDENGKILNFLETDGCNPFDVGIDSSKTVLKDAIHKICSKVTMSDVVCFAGIAGGTSGNNKSVYEEFFKEFNFAAAYNGSDNENVVSAGLGTGDGISVIMGTGICAYRVKNGVMNRISGWGYLIDDGGSAYNIGRDGLAAAYAQADNTGKPTLITDMILNENDDLNAVLSDIYGLGKKKIASYAPLVFEAEKQGDKIAAGIIKRNMKVAAHIIETAAQPFENTPVRVVIAGGLIKQSGLIDRIKRELETPDKFDISCLNVPPVKGAVRLAKHKWNSRNT